MPWSVAVSMYDVDTDTGGATHETSTRSLPEAPARQVTLTEHRVLRKGWSINYGYITELSEHARRQATFVLRAEENIMAGNQLHDLRNVGCSNRLSREG